MRDRRIHLQILKILDFKKIQVKQLIQFQQICRHNSSTEMEIYIYGVFQFIWIHGEYVTKLLISKKRRMKQFQPRLNENISWREVQKHPLSELYEYISG